jgi:hypothetical protein
MTKVDFDGALSPHTAIQMKLTTNGPCYIQIRKLYVSAVATPSVLTAMQECTFRPQKPTHLFTHRAQAVV